MGMYFGNLTDKGMLAVLVYESRRIHIYPRKNPSLALSLSQFLHPECIAANCYLANQLHVEVFFHVPAIYSCGVENVYINLGLFTAQKLQELEDVVSGLEVLSTILL